MKSISKPRLPIEIYTFQEIMSTEEFKKYSSTDGSWVLRLARFPFLKSERVVNRFKLRVESNHDLHGRAYKADANGSRQYGLL